MKSKTFFSVLSGSSFIFGAVSAYAVPPQNTPAAAAGYSNIPNQWQVTSAYGPRNPGGAGSKFHKGIDYSQNDGSLDKGIMLQSRYKGSISVIETSNTTSKYISIISSPYRHAYVHIFDDSPLPIVIANSNITPYTKVVMAKVPKNTGIGTCGAIFFYKLYSGKEAIDKILAQPACSKATLTYGGRTVTAKTTVGTEEKIAPMGTSLPPNGTAAHLHLQLNGGADSPFNLVDHKFGFIDGKTQKFEAALWKYWLIPQVNAAMTNGTGFAVKVTENSLVPVLNTVSVYLDGELAPITLFSFGGMIDETPKNVSEANIKPSLILEKGSSVPAIKPLPWKDKNGKDGSGTPRSSWFFVPYEFKNLTRGYHSLAVGMTDIDALPTWSYIGFCYSDIYVQDDVFGTWTGTSTGTSASLTLNKNGAWNAIVVQGTDTYSGYGTWTEEGCWHNHHWLGDAGTGFTLHVNPNSPDPGFFTPSTLSPKLSNGSLKFWLRNPYHFDVLLAKN